MPEQSKISLLVPCYNAAAYIDEFITHITDLGFAEVIFYDDGSTDNTLELLKLTGYNIIHSAVNQGPGYARNQLAKAAQCDYIHFHDVDDRFNTDFINIVNPYLSQEPDVLVGNADWIIRDNGETLIEWRYNAAEALTDTLTYFIGHPVGIINTVYKRSSFLSSGGFNTQIKCWEDSDLHVTLAALNFKFVFTDQVLAYSLRHTNGISSNQNWCWHCRLKFLQEYLQKLPARYLDAILYEIARCAQIFYDAGMKEDFNKCIAICKRYGMKLPMTQSSFVNLVKNIPLPARSAYDIIRLYKKLFIR